MRSTSAAFEHRVGALDLRIQRVHPKVASERAGHASVRITLDSYSHVLPGLQEDAASRIDDLLRMATERNRR